MAIYKLHIDELEEVNYNLIAIHTSLEDYRLAYYLNQYLPILLTKNKVDIGITGKTGMSNFSRFTYENPEREVSWNLIQNKNETIPVTQDNSQNLFAEAALEQRIQMYLLPELKKVDYFMRIENPGRPIETITNNINKIDRISAVYTVDYSKIRSRNNLIF